MKDLRICLILALAYFATGRLGLMLPAFGSHITLIWLPTGIAVAALLRWSFGCWPGIALGAFAVNVTTGTPWPVALGLAAGNTLAPLLSAWGLRQMRFHPAFDRSRDILLLAAGATLGMLVSSGLGIAILSGAGMVPPGAHLQAWLTWWGGDVFGVIAAAPLVLTFTLAEMRTILRRRLEFAIWSVATGLGTWAVFGANRGEPGQALAIAFAPLPFVAWAAMRFGPVGTSLALIVLSVGAVYGTATQGGPFYWADLILEMELLWIFMATSAVLGWLISALRTAHIKTADTERVFDRTLTDVSLGVLLAGLDRNITYANQGFTRLTGYAEAELLGKSCAILQGPETDPAVVQRLKAALHGDGHFEGELLNYRKDGTTFWNALLISPIYSEKGVSTGFLGIQRDITERKRAELALHQSEQHLRTIIELEPECVKIVSPEGTLLEMNPAGLAMIDAASFEDVRGCTLAELIVPEDRAAFTALHRLAMQGGSGRCEFAITSLKGTRRWLETHAVPYRDGRQEIIGVLGITRDITQKKQHESLVSGQRNVLEMIASSKALPAILTEVVHIIEAQSPEMLCSILLLDPDGIHIRHGAAPSLPEAFSHAVDGLPIGPRAGSCGTAAFRRESVVVADIATDPLWADYRELALQHGLRACWSTPIFDERQAVLGTFAIYYREPGRPSPFHLQCIELATGLAAIAISRKRAESTLQMMRLSVDRAGDAVFWLSSEGRILYVNDSACAGRGYSREELLKMTIFDLDPDFQPGVWAPHWEELKRRQTITIESRHRCKDGRVFPIEVNANYVEVGGEKLNFAFVRDITTRKITEAALRDSEERLRLALSAANQGLYDLDIPTGEAKVSAEYATMLGYDPDDFRETNARWIERLHLDDYDRMAATFQAYVEGRIPVYQVEFRQRTAGGKWKWILSQGKIVERDAQGRPRRMLGTHTDITQRKQAESALQERERSYAALLKNLAGMVYRCNNDPDWTTTFVSDGCIAVTGYRPEDLIGNRKVSLGALIHPDDAGPVWEKCQAGLATRRPCSNEYRIRTASGTEQWVWDQAQGVYSETGELLFIEGYMSDITVRKQAEVALRESEEKFGKAFRNSPDAVLITTLEGRILEANAGFTRLTGYTFEEVHGRTTMEVRFWANGVDRHRFISELEERGRVMELEAVFQTRTDELRTCLISGELMELDGKPAIVGVVRDITERKQAEAKVRDLGRRLLRAEDKERRRIAKELHDSTAQDLVAVMMNLGTLREAVGGPSGQVLDDSIALVENSVNEIRTLSYVLHPPRLDEMGLPGALTEYAAGLAARADIRIRVEVAPDFGRLPEEMELALFRVAQESLGNAVRHSQSDAVTIRLSRTDGRIVFEIEDFGRGMPSGERAIPGPYGVGIAGMRERLQQLGGNLEIESDDRGTIVRAVMPSKEQTE